MEIFVPVNESEIPEKESDLAEKFGPGYFGEEQEGDDGSATSGYETYPYADLEEKRDKLFWWFREKLRNYAKEGNKVETMLDVGGAYGFWAVTVLEDKILYETLGKKVPKVCAVGDISKSALKEAKKIADKHGLEKEFGGSLVKLNAEKGLPFKSESLDVVTAFDSLEHTRDFEGSLRECYRLLRPGGLLLMSVPVADRGSYLAGKDKDETHWSVPSTRELIEVIGEVGFDFTEGEEIVLDSPIFIPQGLLREKGIKWPWRKDLEKLPPEELRKLKTLPLPRGIHVAAIKPVVGE